MIQKNGDLFRKRLSVTAEKMLELQQSLCLVGVQVDPFVTYDKAEACLDHLLDKKELLDSYNMSLMVLRIHNKENLCFFSQSSGTVNLPYDVSDTQLKKFLLECKAMQSFANYRIARKSIQHIKKILLEKAKIESLQIPKRILTNTLAYQSVMGRLLDYITNHAPYNTLEKVNVVIQDRLEIKYKKGVLRLPTSFRPSEVDAYFRQLVQDTKSAFDARLGHSLPPPSGQPSHLPSEAEKPLLLKE